MNAKRNINMTKLDHYYEQRLSFKCSDIERWCEHNMDNPNFDIAHAASELYNHYFASNRKPHRNFYYYIRYNANSRYLYRLERDKVLSPPVLPVVDAARMHLLVSNIGKLEDKIKNHKNTTQDDLDKLREIDSIFNRRCRTIIHSRLNMEKFNKLSHKDKGIIKFICEDKFKELQLRCIILDGISDGDSN